MWIKTWMLSEPTEKPRFERVAGNKTYNGIIKYISKQFNLPTKIVSDFRRAKEIILGEGEDRLLIQIVSELPPGEKDETLPE